MEFIKTLWIGWINLSCFLNGKCGEGPGEGDGEGELGGDSSKLYKNLEKMSLNFSKNSFALCKLYGLAEKSQEFRSLTLLLYRDPQHQADKVLLAVREIRARCILADIGQGNSEQNCTKVETLRYSPVNLVRQNCSKGVCCTISSLLQSTVHSHVKG